MKTHMMLVIGACPWLHRLPGQTKATPLPGGFPLGGTRGPAATWWAATTEERSPQVCMYLRVVRYSLPNSEFSRLNLSFHFRPAHASKQFIPTNPRFPTSPFLNSFFPLLIPDGSTIPLHHQSQHTNNLLPLFHTEPHPERPDINTVTYPPSYLP